MAKAKKNKAQNEQKDGMNNITYGILTVLISLLIFSGVFLGASYYILHNNVNNLGERYREQLKNIPLLRYALPPLPQGEDPEDPKNFPQKELLDRYNDMRKLKNDLAKQLEDASNKIKELEGANTSEPDLQSQIDMQKQELDLREQELGKREENLKKEKEAVDALIANGDTEGFQEFFQSMDKVQAEKIYREIMVKEKINQEAQDFVKKYEEMDAAAAASIFENMGDSQLDLTVKILGNMKTKSYSEIVSQMSPEFAGKVTKKMAEEKLKQ